MINATQIGKSWWLFVKFDTLYTIDCRGVGQLEGTTTRLFSVGPTKFKDRKSFQFTKKFPCGTDIKEKVIYFEVFMW